MLRALVLAGLVLAATPLAAEPVVVMAYNVENLFDTQDDPANRFDDPYLPKAVKDTRLGHDARCAQTMRSPAEIKSCQDLDWNALALHRKMQGIASVVEAVSPDVLVLLETENPEVVELLRDDYLADLDFQTLVHLDGSSIITDTGIDVAILSRLPLAERETAHIVRYTGREDDVCVATRDIVQAPLALPDGAVLHVFGLHLPAGDYPFFCRRVAMQTLNAAAGRLPENALKLAIGSFNFTCSEAQGDAVTRLLLEGGWQIPPEVQSGCREPGTSKDRQPGYDNWSSWSFLDFALVSQNLLDRASKSGWYANLGSFRTLVVDERQIDADDSGAVSPRRTSAGGISDHWPVAIDLIPRSSE
ncbi:MAG: endonuclease/exonuclease/phosphatase family protein [Kiloniellales bacterium]